MLEHLEPQAVLRRFEELAAIPRGSGHTKAVSDHCAAFAEARGLDCRQDALGNVVISAPASPGYEGSPAVIVQGHLDMVCAKAPGCEKDMEREGVTLRVDGDWLSAEGTTLGGDDGAGVAIALALLDDPSIPRPRLEAVFTVDEETGMFGAQGLDAEGLQGRTVLNLDSEAEGIFTVSCAGGTRANCAWSFPVGKDRGLPVTLEISGLTGGHSGVEIDKGRANANVLMGRLLHELEKHAALRLISLEGGEADNAIPTRCAAHLALRPKKLDALLAVVEHCRAAFAGEYRVSDPSLTLRCEVGGEEKLKALSPADSARLIDALLLFPCGVQAMSLDMPGLVETSLNLGILRLEHGRARMSFSLRSSVASRKELLRERVSRVCALTGGSVAFAGDYPAWEYRAESPLRDRMVEIYRRMFGQEPQIVAIHAGLECGILAGKLPGMDCVSIGPQMEHIHTPDERLSLSSLARTWEFVKEILRESR